MPILNLVVSTHTDPGRSTHIATRLSALTAEHARKDPLVAKIAVHDVAPEHWFAGDRSLSESDEASFWLHIKVADSTNTNAHMADYVRALSGEMSALLSAPLHDESYILMHKAPGAAYGFDGVTQEHRFIAGRLQETAHA
ncbi:tautomerase family protein [Belnapia sp. T18]|uniref:Tautomerase family protein n=1 Tax=Belnapia arida TaxID=2804533 RepID=A0ABS1UCG0_9PROT|nr:tautomerase family protein [Belnapia arida]MBL6082366.1 tautomerase family protein [Belnapia arida]